MDLLHDLLPGPQTAVGDGLELLGGQIVDGLSVGGKLSSLCQLEVEYSDIQPPPGGDLGVQLPQGAGGGVAGIGHEGLSLDLPLAVQFFKDGAGHVHLAPDDEPGQLLRQGHGDGADGSQILRHVLSDAAVASGGAADEHAVPVLQRHGQAVHLRLHAVFGIREGLPDVSQELLHLPAVKHVLQALQRDGVLHLLKLGQDGSAHPLGGGVRGDLLRVLPLQILQTAEHMVVFIVGDLRIVQHVVAVAVGVEGIPQPFHFFPIIHSRPLIRCSRYSPQRTAPSPPAWC